MLEQTSLDDLNGKSTKGRSWSARARERVRKKGEGGGSRALQAGGASRAMAGESGRAGVLTRKLPLQLTAKWQEPACPFELTI